MVADDDAGVCVVSIIWSPFARPKLDTGSSGMSVNWCGGYPAFTFQPIMKCDDNDVLQDSIDPSDSREAERDAQSCCEGKTLVCSLIFCCRS